MNSESEKSQASVYEATDDATDDKPSSIAAECRSPQGQMRDCVPAASAVINVALSDAAVNKSSKSVS